MHPITFAEPLMDTLRMKQVLDGVADQRGKIARLLDSGELILLRRGLYATRRDLDPPALAGPIYGPSYLSFETALSWHGMIPEGVTEILSATLRRPAVFSNAFGSYRFLTVPKAVYPVGISRVETGGLPFLIASPTKALADRIAREPGFRSIADVRRWLDGMRIAPETPLDRDEMAACAAGYGRPAVRWLLRYAEKHDLFAEPHPQP
jgi:hypothetical protein